MSKILQKFSSKIFDVEPMNPTFSKCKIQVMYHGLNRNGSNIPKPVVEDAIPTIYNIPIIGEFKEEKNDFGSHGGRLEISDEGMKYVITTKPYGVVPESATVSWQNITDDNGNPQEYLVIEDAYLWTGRYEEANQIIEDGKAQSMEVEFPKYHFDKKGKFVADEMVFSALCILGDDVEPAFENASISASFSTADDIKSVFEEMLKELKVFGLIEGSDKMTTAKFEAAPSDSAKKEIEIDNTKAAADTDGAWSGVDKAALRKELTEATNAGALVKEGYLIVDANWREAPSESLHYPHHVVKSGKLVVHEKGLEAAHARLAQVDPDKKDEGAWQHLERHYKELGLDMSSFSLNFALTAQQLASELSMILQNEDQVDDDFFWFDMPRYWYVDNLPDQGIVIADDMQNNYLVGFPYTLTGDVVAVDFDKGARYVIDYRVLQAKGPDGDEHVTNDYDGDEFAYNAGTKQKLKFMLEFAEKKVREKMESDNKEKGTTDAQDGQENKKEDMSLIDSPSDVEEIQVDDLPSSEDLNIEPDMGNTGAIADFEAVKEELEQLRAYKLQKDQEEKQRLEDEVFQKFASKLNEQEVEELRGKYSADVLEEKIYAILGKKSATFSNTSATAVRTPVFEALEIKQSGKPYANLIEKYTSRK